MIGAWTFGRSDVVHRFRCLPPILIALALAGPASGQTMDMGDNPADAAFLQAMKNMMIGMHQSMPTGETDGDFVRFMLPHHQAAVDMAKTELQYGKDPELKRLATDIVAAQDKEIAEMKDWLAKHAK
jgi:uncharacterized protein (DUF305 family)